MRTALVALVAVGCGGPVEETLVDELRIIAAVPAQPEVTPGEPLDARVYVEDPSGQGAESWAWLCTAQGPPGTPCLEASRGTTEGWITRVDDDGMASGLVPSAAARAGLSDEVPVVPSTLWVLSCTPGICDRVDAFVGRDDADDGWASLVLSLSDPTLLAADLPLAGTSLARRTVVLSDRPAEARNTHPVFSDLPGGLLSAPPDGEARFSLAVSDSTAVTVFGYTTLGGFDAISVEAEAEAEPVELAWLPGELAEVGEQARLYVVASDGLGGEAVWLGEAEVRAP